VNRTATFCALANTARLVLHILRNHTRGPGQRGHPITSVGAFLYPHGTEEQLIRLEIFDRQGDLITSVRNVVSHWVSDRGVLVVNLDPPPTSTTHRLAYAHGYWGAVHESSSADPDGPEHDPAGAATVASDARTFRDELSTMLAHQQDSAATSPATESHELTDRDRVHLAMGVHCCCYELRCPTVLNPARPEEKGWWRKRQKVGPGLNRQAPDPEPRMQCVQRDGHRGAHYWQEGVWIYGPANHHPDCPRHPLRYNRAGQVPRPAPGATRGQPPGYLPPALPAPAPLTLEEMFSGPAEFRPGRPVTNPDDPSWGFSRGDTEVIADPENFNAIMREQKGLCAGYAPGYPRTLWCGLVRGHAGNCTQVTAGGEVITW